MGGGVKYQRNIDERTNPCTGGSCTWRKAKKKQKVIEVKEIRLSPNIDVNDLNTKANQARKFVTKGDKVKVTLRFRGREMAHVQTGREIMDGFVEKLADCATVDKAAKMEGRSLVVILPKKRDN